jgi:hypothetical protein
MGVVLQSQNRLYGFHAMPGDVDRIGGFVQFIRNSGSAVNPVHLYGSCIRSKRCSGSLAQWQAEMTKVATALNYHGPVSGYDLPAYPNLRNGTADTTYVEYCRDDSGTCKIFYKRMSKMTVRKGDNPSTDSIERLTKRKGVFVTELPTVQVAVSADIIKTYWNDGEMHQVAASEIDSFNV